MRTENLIGELRKIFSEMKNNGQTAVAISILETYFNDIEKIINDPQSQLSEKQLHELTLKQLEINNEKWKVQTESRTAFGIELFRAVIEAGQTAIKSLILMNGGAAIALLAFLGNLLSRPPNVGDTVLIAKINTAMLIFLGGVALAGMTSAIRYISQALYADIDIPHRGDLARNIAVLLAFGSIGAFLWGGYTAYRAIS